MKILMEWLNGRKKDSFHSLGQICKSKELNGLGLGDIQIKNRALLTKWIWHFDNEHESPQRRIITEKIGINQLNLLPITAKDHNSSQVWKNIVKPLSSHNGYNSTILISFGKVVEDDKNIVFWCDEWINGVELRAEFPRIMCCQLIKLARLLSLVSGTIMFGCGKLIFIETFLVEKQTNGTNL